MNPALSQEFHLFCEQEQLHATLDKKPYCVYGTLKAGVISTELRYHFSHETLGNMLACDSPCLYCTPHSPVVSLAMQLVIHDECLVSECPTA